MRYLVVILVLAALSSCKPQKEKDKDRLRELKKEVWGKDAKIDTAKATKLDNAYKEYVDKYPDDSLNALLLYEDARLQQTILGNSDAAIRQYSQVYERYPKDSLAPLALFQSAFIYDNEFNNVVLARERYQRLIDQYPDHPFAGDAKTLLHLLGKDLNDVLKDKDSLENVENSGRMPN